MKNKINLLIDISFNLIMSANQTNIQVSSSNLTNCSSPSQFLDQAIAIETLKLMDKTLSNGKWSFAVVGTVFFILSLDGVKRVIINLVDKSITYLCNMTGEQWANVGSAIISPVKIVGKGVTLPFKYAYQKFNPQPKLVKPTLPQTYPLEYTDSLFKLLYERQEFSFDSSIVNIKHIGNGSEIQQTERWRNMRINTQNFNVYFEGNLDIVFTIKSTTSGSPLKLFSKSEVSSSQDENLFTYDENIHKLPVDIYREQGLTNTYIKDCKAIVTLTLFSKDIRKLHEFLALKVVPNKFDCIMYNIIMFFGCKLYLDTQKFCKDYIFKVKHIKDSKNEDMHDVSHLYSNSSLFLTIVNNLNYGFEATCIYLYISMLYVCIGDNLSLYDYISRLPTLGYFSGFIYLTKSDDNYSIIQSQLNSMKKLVDQNIFKDIPLNLVLEFKRWFLMFTEVITRSTSPKKEENIQPSSNSVINFYIHSSLQEPLPEFTKWISKISTETTSNNKDIESLKIKANYIKVEKSIKTENIKNPEHESWVNTVQKFIPTDKEKQSSQTVINSSLFDKMPTEFITTTKEVTEVKCDHVNSIYKGINTLYLQTGDYRKLFNSLDNFKNRKQLLQELGFPLKLGILLHGVPGTGKSATILAIASYLQKDLFYVDLRSVKTNKDLKMIFDHILTINLNGGILVFEDIDCATKTVLKRDENYFVESTTDTLSKDDTEFTLDYFLNMLQGTLTRDNTIFIMTTNHVNKLDSALIRDGRVDVTIEMKLTNKEQISQMWKTIFKRDVSIEVLNKFKEFEYKPATILSRCAEFLTNGEDINDEEILRPFLIRV